MGQGRSRYPHQPGMNGAGADQGDTFPQPGIK